METYDLVRDLPVRIESYTLERLRLPVSSEFVRVSTVVRLIGGGEEGAGEDVTYDPADHDAFLEHGAGFDLGGDDTLEGFSERLEGIDLFSRRPTMKAARNYRRWAFESAALDLALRQCGRSLADVLNRRPAPVRFVVSMRLGEPPSVASFDAWRQLVPGLQFKLDPTSAWDEGLIADLAASGAVVSVDFKGFYKGTIVDQPADPVLYRRIVEAFPDAWLEDPHLGPATDEILRPHRDRITWDAPIHSVEDIEALPFPPRSLNIKPSRFGSVRSLFEAYDYCREHDIANYGGGQFELGVGRGQIQSLASLFHPDGPNDVAPAGYNAPRPVAGLPTSPLEPGLSEIGFRWDPV